MKPQLSDSELLYLISSGNREAFAQLYTRYLNNIYRYIYTVSNNREASEEIVQQLFVKIWENRQQLVQVTSIKSYLYRSAKNLLLNYIKRSQVQTKAHELICHHTETAAMSPYDILVQSENDLLARNAIDLLPEKRRQIFKMRLNEELTLDEIAFKLNISKSVVKKQLYSGIKFVRKYLEQSGAVSLLIAVNFFLS